MRNSTWIDNTKLLTESPCQTKKGKPTRSPLNRSKKTTQPKLKHNWNNSVLRYERRELYRWFGKFRWFLSLCLAEVEPFNPLCGLLQIVYTHGIRTSQYHLFTLLGNETKRKGIDTVIVWERRFREYLKGTTKEKKRSGGDLDFLEKKKGSGDFF